jgi:hypothetical protein
MDALISTGEEGLSQMALAEITSLSASSIGVNLEYMMSTDIVRYRSESVGKVFFANYELLGSLFSFMNKNYGSGMSQTDRAKLG